MKSLSFEFPIFSTRPFSEQDNITINSLIQATDNNAAKNYNTAPLFSVEFDSLQWAAVDSTTCLRRGWCNPIGGYSVWSSHTNITEAPNKGLLFVTSQLNGAEGGLFADLTLSSAAMAGIAATLGVADALSNVNPRDFDKTIVFAFFGI